MELPIFHGATNSPKAKKKSVVPFLAPFLSSYLHIVAGPCQSNQNNDGHNKQGNYHHQ